MRCRRIAIFRAEARPGVELRARTILTLSSVSPSPHLDGPPYAHDHCGVCFPSASGETGFGISIVFSFFKIDVKVSIYKSLIHVFVFLSSVFTFLSSLNLCIGSSTCTE